MASRSAQNPVEMAPSIDSFLVADCADAVNGKLYVMGAGFDTVLFTAIPALVQFALAAVFHVPWNDTNRRLRVEAQLEDDNYDSLGWWNLQGEVEAGRPAGARGGNVPIVFATKVMFQIP